MGYGHRGGAEGQGEVVGADAEGEVGEEEGCYVGDAEIGADLEAGTFSFCRFYIYKWKGESWLLI